MLEYIYGQNAIVADFVAQFIPECRERGFGKCTAIGVADETGLIAGLVYKNFQPELGTIEISAAALPETNWYSRRTIQVMHEYPYYQCGCQMVIITTMDSNLIVQRILSAIGYKFYRIERLGGRDKDGIVCTLTVEQWEASKYNTSRKTAAEQEAA